MTYHSYHIVDIGLWKVDTGLDIYNRKQSLVSRHHYAGDFHITVRFDKICICVPGCLFLLRDPIPGAVSSREVSVTQTWMMAAESWSKGSQMRHLKWICQVCAGNETTKSPACGHNPIFREYRLCGQTCRSLKYCDLAGTHWLATSELQVSESDYLF